MKSVVIDRVNNLIKRIKLREKILVGILILNIILIYNSSKINFLLIKYENYLISKQLNIPYDYNIENKGYVIRFPTEYISDICRKYKERKKISLFFKEYKKAVTEWENSEDDIYTIGIKTLIFIGYDENDMIRMVNDRPDVSVDKLNLKVYGLYVGIPNLLSAIVIALYYMFFIIRRIGVRSTLLTGEKESGSNLECAEKAS